MSENTYNMLFSNPGVCMCLSVSLQATCHVGGVIMKCVVVVWFLCAIDKGKSGHIPVSYFRGHRDPPVALRNHGVLTPVSVVITIIWYCDISLMSYLI